MYSHTSFGMSQIRLALLGSWSVPRGQKRAEALDCIGYMGFRRLLPIVVTGDLLHGDQNTSTFRIGLRAWFKSAFASSSLSSANNACARQWK